MQGQANTPWDTRLNSSARALKGSAIRELLKITEQPGVISFAGGLPAPACFPAEEIALATERVLAHEATRVLQYGPTEGFPPLREFLAALMATRGIEAPTERILISSGSQQALDMIAKVMIDPGDVVLVEDPTYVGALQAFRPYQPRFVALPMDEHGLQVDTLEAMLADLAAGGIAPKFLYTVPTFQNPTGVTLTRARRAALLELAERYDLPIVEDDPYGELRYSGEPLPPLAALDIARHGQPRHVLYLSTFSKLLAPSLRVGWMVGPDELLHKLALVKQGMDLHTGSLVQAIAFESCRDGLLERHTPRIRAVYHERRDAMLAALAREMPADIRWTTPEGGMFLWLTVPDELNVRALLERAIARQVAFVPGDAFFANGGGANSLRLNFSHPSAERIAEGVARLAAAIER
ncbi:MAG: PLP-dependent aminotransferase family protein [Roseiflexaceae bacterium]|nr:PLP-dependent aminotransferase family protein [Roseiflexaceae bacterium]